MKIATSHANRGRSLETTVLSSQTIVRVVKVPNGTRYLVGGKTVGVKSPVDFVGCVVGSGRGIAFEAKKCALKGGYPISNLDHFPAHQRKFLYRWEEAGGIAGVLIESSHTERFYWMTALAVGVWSTGSFGGTVNWYDRELLTDLGPTSHAIDFSRVPGVIE